MARVVMLMGDSIVVAISQVDFGRAAIRFFKMILKEKDGSRIDSIGRCLASGSVKASNQIRRTL